MTTDKKRFMPRPVQQKSEHFLDAQPARDDRALVLPIANIRLKKNIRSDLGDLTELRESIQTRGIINPLLIAKAEGALELVGGFRRLECARQLGLKEVPVRIIEGDAEVVALLDNLQRENLSGWDTCQAIASLVPRFRSQRELAAAINKTESYVSKAIAVIKANPTSELERVQVLSLRELFQSIQAESPKPTDSSKDKSDLGSNKRQPSGPVAGGRFGAEGAIQLKERQDGKGFSLRLNWDRERTPPDSVAKIISTLESILQKLRSSK